MALGKRSMAWLLLLLVLTASGAFANKFLEYDHVEMRDSTTGQTGAFETVNMTLYGQDLFSDVPAILYPGNRTLVPVGMIATALGAEVTWDADKRQVGITREDLDVLLTIDSKSAVVNGQRIQLPSDVPAKIMSYRGIGRTMVPVRFIADVFGLEITWIGETKTVAMNEPSQKITGYDFFYLTEFPEIRLPSTGEIKTTTYTIDGEEVGANTKLIVDLQNTVMDFSGGALTDTIEMLGLGTLTIEQVRDKPPMTRVTLDLSQKKGYEVFYDERTQDVVIRFINSVDAVNLERIYSAQTVVVSTAEEMPAYNVIYDPDRVVLDIIGAKMQVSEGRRTVEPGDGEEIAQYSHSQMAVSQAQELYGTSDVARVIVELGEERSAEDVYVEYIGTDLFVYVSGNPLEGFEYVKTQREQSQLTLALGKDAHYRLDQNDQKRLATLEVPIESLSLNDMVIDTDDTIVEGIDVKRVEEEGLYRMSFALMEGTVVSENWSPTGQLRLSFLNERIANSVFSDVLLVLDPGHGGRDPGAVGAKLYEKDVVLDLTLQLKKRLEADGFKIYLTREDDRYVDLYDRPAIANQLGATALISIHANAHTSSTAKGVEVLYAPDATRPSVGLARSLQDALVQGLGAVDRGVIERPRLAVLRETKMPAVLAEVGFLSNPDEHALLQSQAYRERIVEALYRGILRHYE